MFDNYIFDFDGTLADSKICSILATKEAFLEFGLKEPSEKEIEYFMGIPIEQSFIELSEQKLNDKELEELIAIFRINYKYLENSNIKLFPKIFEKLEELTKSKKKLFVVSSKKSDVLMRNMKTLGISDFFTEAIGSDKVQKYKPNPDGIEYILNKYELNKKSTIYIGDAIFDIQMAKSIDVSSCAVTWGSHSKKSLSSENPSYIIDLINELKL